MKVSGTALGLAAGGVAVAGILVAAVVRAQPAAAGAGKTTPPAPSSSSPWALQQGHRYQVTVRAPGGSDWRDINYQNLPAGLAFVREVGRTGFTLTYQIDCTAADHEEPAASFFLGSQAPELDVVVADMGPSAGQPPPQPMPTPATPPATGGGTSSPGPTPTGAGAAWTPAQSVSVGQRVRFSIANSDILLFAAAQHIGGIANATPGENRHLLETLLATGAAGSRLQSRVFFVWAPGNALPADWPTSDPSIGKGFQVEMVYGIGYAVAQIAGNPTPAPSLSAADLKALGFNAQGFWSVSGSGRTSLTGLPAQPAVTWTPASKVQIGDHFRMSNVATSLTVNPAFAALGDAARLSMYAYAHSAALAFGGVPVLAWAPGDSVPPDWPAADPSPDTEIHLETRTGASFDFTALTAAAGRLWIASGAGA